MQSNGGHEQGNAGIARSGLIKIGAVLLGIALVLLSLTAVFRQHATDDAAGSGSADSGRFVLPTRSVDATEILGRSRDFVRDMLGQPSHSDELIDTFNLGIAIDIRYENETAIGLTLSAPEISRNERKVRRWLLIPADGPIVIGGAVYRFTYTVGDSRRLSLSPETGQPLPVPARAVAPSGPNIPLGSAEALLKVFPSLPPKIRAGCRSVANGRALSCGGLNARVSVELDDSGSPISLTVFDPPGRATEESCRAALEQNIEGAKQTASKFYSAPSVDAVYAFSVLPGPNKVGSCSLMVCRKAGAIEGGRSPCGARY